MRICRFQKGSVKRYEYRMEIKKKPAAWVLVAVYGFWELVAQPLWNLNLERLAESQKLDRTLSRGGLMDWFHWFVSYVPSSFGLGLVTGSLIFAYWDLISAWFNRAVMRSPEPVAEPEEPADFRAWVGCMTPYFDRGEPALPRLFIDAVNCGECAWRVASLSGNIKFSYENPHGSGRKTATLSPPVTGDMAQWREWTPPKYIITMDFIQPIPSDVAKYLPDLFTWGKGASFDFSELIITLETEDGRTKKLKLWESMRLSVGEWDIRSVQTFPLFKDEEERKAVTEGLAAAAKLIAGRN